MPEALRRPAVPVAAALGLAALSLLAPWAIAFDAWSWIVWGREVTRLELDTAGGPSWKPFSVLFTTPYALAGEAAPALWLLTARAGGLLALGGVAALAYRLAGPVAGVVAPVVMALSDWWLFHTALGNSEGLLAAATAWAVVAHLGGRHRAALACALAAALIRPEAWPFLGLYGLWLWLTGREPLWVVALGLAPVPLLWFGPDVVGAGGALGASDAALAYAAPESAANAAVPVLEVWRDYAELLSYPALAAAVAGVVVGGRTARLLAAGAAAWIALVGVMSQLGYAGNPRYSVPAAVIGCALAGVAVARIPRRGLAAAAGTVLAAAVLATTAGELEDQLVELGDRAERRRDLWALVDDRGGAAALRERGPIRTFQGMRSMVAWRLDVRMARLVDPPAPGDVVFQAPPLYEPYEAKPEWTGTVPPPEPEAPCFDAVARRGDWSLLLDRPDLVCVTLEAEVRGGAPKR